MNERLGRTVFCLGVSSGSCSQGASSRHSTYQRVGTHGAGLASGDVHLGSHHGARVDALQVHHHRPVVLRPQTTPPPQSSNRRFGSAVALVIPSRIRFSLSPGELTNCSLTTSPCHHQQLLLPSSPGPRAHYLVVCHSHHQRDALRGEGLVERGGERRGGRRGVCAVQNHQPGTRHTVVTLPKTQRAPPDHVKSYG
jgi:hypothetical protein